MLRQGDTSREVRIQKEIVDNFITTTFFKKDYIDYHEGLMHPGKLVFVGDQVNGLSTYYGDINISGEKSRYIGHVLYPERASRTGMDYGWTWEKNMAFFAGAIDSQRPFYLCTDIIYYPSEKMKKESRVNGTVAEILWLAQNGYTFQPDFGNLNKTLCSPPKQPLQTNKLQYSFDLNVANKTFEIIKSKVLKQRDEWAFPRKSTVSINQDYTNISFFKPISLYSRTENVQKNKVIVYS